MSDLGTPETSPVEPVDTDRHPLDLLAEQFADLCRKGERPSVNDFAIAHPEWADQLREMLPPIALMERLKARNLSGSGSVTAPLVLDQLGDFRIVRELGRGGMGIVYEARQESLGRHVALKVLSRASMLDPQRIERFEREARAAAGLHHTNIVPVFGVGQSDGLHYYVMQYIAGRSLSEVIGAFVPGPHPGMPSRSSRIGPRSGTTTAVAPPPASGTVAPRDDVPRGRAYWAWVADVGRQAASALDYAHRQGVLHRDVKPGNLLLDERGGVWIADFGLAKLGESVNVTRSGDVIGTLQYLAPEALKSQADARSDVYGLGATLYELLTLKPAFEAPHAAGLMRKVAEGTPVAPRRINPQIPPDLETIVLKAMARQPEGRYQTAGRLAEDLENFLRDRPIFARRITLPERAWRWCRRNKALASLSATAIAAAIAAIILGWTAYAVTRKALETEANRRVEIEAARKRADDNVALSLQGFEEVFNRLAPRDSRPPPGPWFGGDGPPRPADGGRDNQDAAVLGSILSFYDRFAKQNPTNDALRAEAAKAYRRVGDSYLNLGRSTDADESFRQSAAIYLELLKEEPDDIGYRLGLAEAVTWLGTTQSIPPVEDSALVHRAAELVASVASEPGADPDQVGVVARVMLRDGECLKTLGKLEEAEARFRKSIAVWSNEQPPPDDEIRRRPRPISDEPIALLALAELQEETHRHDAAVSTVKEAFANLNEQRQSRFGGARISQAYQRLAKTATLVGLTDLATQATANAEQFKRPERDGRPGDGRPGDGRPGDGRPRQPPPPGVR